MSQSMNPEMAAQWGAFGEAIDARASMAAAISGSRIPAEEAAQLIGNVNGVTEPVEPIVGGRRGHGDEGMSRLGTGLTIGAAVLLAGGSYAAYSHYETGSKKASTQETGKPVDCDTSNFANVSARPNEYNDTAFLPHTDKLGNNDEASQYVLSLFDQNGPLAGQLDPVSLAAIEAVAVVPSHDGVATNPDYDYVKTFKDKYAAYSQSDGGLELAKKDCVVARDTLVQTGQFNGTWAVKGETVTLFKALRDTNNQDVAKRYNIIDMKPVKVVTQDTLGGVEFTVRASNKGIDGFISILLTKEGDLYIKGFTEGQGTGTAPIENNQAPAGEPTAETGPNQGNRATGGAAGPNGANPEAGPNGVTNSPANGGNGGAGTTVTVGSGGTTTTTTGGGTTTTTTGGGSSTTTTNTTSTTQPSTTTTTSPSTTTTSSTIPQETTTTKPKGDEPPCTPTQYTPCP